MTGLSGPKYIQTRNQGLPGLPARAQVMDAWDQQAAENVSRPLKAKDEWRGTAARS
jgi:hypothetical protein